MTSRPSVPVRTRRILWSESMGHCMNPECQVDLFPNGSCIGELAHIVPHAQGGSVSEDNLLVLCNNCHKVIDDRRSKHTCDMLSVWKAARSQEIHAQFSRTYSSFSDLRRVVVPILQRNLQIYNSYGPMADSSMETARRDLWLMFESELITNNRRLEIILDKNRGLLHRENRDIIDTFSAHAREFVRTRGPCPNPRAILFPEHLHSVFGLERVHTLLAPNVSALQNLISQLISQRRFSQLELAPRQVLTYTYNGRSQELSLNDRPRVQQIFWTDHCYRPHTTNLRLDGLVFVVRWLQERGVQYAFPDYTKLSELAIGGEYNVVLCYEYCVSAAVLEEIIKPHTNIVVNLHNWNDGPFSGQGGAYASRMDVQLLNQREFFVFVHEHQT